MFRRIAVAGFALALAAAALPLAHAQFADDTQSLFTGDPDAPKTQDDLLIFDLDNPEDEEEVTGSSSQAQSVEELCCSLSAAERAADGLCFEAQCPEE